MDWSDFTSRAWEAWTPTVAALPPAIVLELAHNMGNVLEEVSRRWPSVRSDAEALRLVIGVASTTRPRAAAAAGTWPQLLDAWVHQMDPAPVPT